MHPVERPEDQRHGRGAAAAKIIALIFTPAGFSQSGSMIGQFRAVR